MERRTLLAVALLVLIGLIWQLIGLPGLIVLLAALIVVAWWVAPLFRSTPPAE